MCSAVSPLHLPYISPISPLHLPYISPIYQARFHVLGCEDVDGFDAVAKGEKVEPVREI